MSLTLLSVHPYALPSPCTRRRHRCHRRFSLPTMAIIQLSSRMWPSISRPLQRNCTFHTSSTARASILFALGALSNSRETQHFNKLSRLKRVEHSPPLKLIQTSEVDPWPLPTPPLKPVPQPWHRSSTSTASAAEVWDAKALRVGRVILANEARRTNRLQRLLMRSRKRAARQEARLTKDKSAWQAERRKMRNDMRAAGIWILLSMGTATALATWRFWPQKDRYPDSAELGRKIAARAKAAIPAPAVVRAEPAAILPDVASSGSSPSVSKQMTVTPKRKAPLKQTPVKPTPQSQSSWWSGLFWKQ